MSEAAAQVKQVSEIAEKAVEEQAASVKAAFGAATELAEKAVAEQTANVKAALGAVTKLQARGVEQAGLLAQNVQSVVELAREQVVFAGTIMSTWGKQVRAATLEWGKQVLAATRSAAEAARTATEALTKKA
jgi:hypothetical protein